MKLTYNHKGQYWLAEFRLAGGKLLLAEGKTFSDAVHGMVLLFRAK